MQMEQTGKKQKPGKVYEQKREENANERRERCQCSGQFGLELLRTTGNGQRQRGDSENDTKQTGIVIRLAAEKWQPLQAPWPLPLPCIEPILVPLG